MSELSIDINKERQRKRSLSESQSSNSSTSSSTSSVDHITTDRAEKKSKKHKHDKKKHKKKEKKHKKEKKSKKDKKHKKHSSSSTDAALAVNQNEYGKYGIIKESDFFKFQREFEVYMEEVRHMPGIMGQSKRDVMEYFKFFIEDFNTVTMPHPKYYAFEKWEMEEYKRTQNKSSSTHHHYDDDNKEFTFNDEEARRIERKQRREEEGKQALQAAYSKMASDKDKREGLRLQETLKGQLQMAFKMGDKEEVARIEKLLAPDDKSRDGSNVAHPWAK